ncbi:MAG: phage portal protein [Actinomycetota bacterium]
MLDEPELHRVITSLRRARVQEWPRLANIRRYLRNEATQDIFVPDEATDEYRMLVDQARFNITPMFVDGLSQNLRVDGYRPTTESGLISPDNSPIWDRIWQPNRMDKRQAAVHRAAIKYGTSYVTVLPGAVGGKPVPKLTPWSPLRLTALYEDPVNDEWPQYAMSVADWDTLNTTGFRPDPGSVDPVAQSTIGAVKVRVYDSTHVYTLEVDPKTDRAEPKLMSALEHGLEVCPVVRFLDEIDDELPLGKIEPQLPIQRQINQTTYSLLQTQHHQAFKQRWVTGMLIETDPVTGQEIEPFNAAVDKLFQVESPDAKFGEFSATDLTGYLKSRDAALLFAAFTGRVSAHALMLAGGIANINAETLTALESRERHDIDAHKTSFGESWEQVSRLGGRALARTEGVDAATRELGEEAWDDYSAQVVWADTTPRSFGEVADALGKMATMLNIPVEALWERIPGVTDQDIARWKEMGNQAAVADEIGAMMADLGQDPAEIKAKADAMGVLIRSGVEPESAARMVGLNGVEFTGAVPVSLRLPEGEAAELEDA